MLLKFLTVAQKSFSIDVEESETILQVKEKIFQKQGEGYEPESVRLILSGKILQDQKTVLEYKELKIQDAKIIVMGRNKKAELEQSKKEQYEKHIEKSKKLGEGSTRSFYKEQQKTTAEKFENFFDGTPKNLDDVIDVMNGIGIPRDYANDALKKFEGDPNLAAEYLFQSDAIDDTQNKGKKYNTFFPIVDEASSKSSVSLLQEHPKFPKLCAAIAKNPSLIIPILSELGQQSISSLHYVTTYPNEFYQMVINRLNHDKKLSETQQNLNNNVEQDRNTIQVTVDEKKVIDKICEMGFDSNAVIQAYFAFEKDENKTVNFLLNENNTNDEQTSQNNKK